MPRLHRLEQGKYIALSLLCWGSIWSCSSSDKEKIQAAGLADGCTLNSDCRNPLVCTFTRCHVECRTDRDCPGEQRCVKGETGSVCQLKLETDCSTKPTVCKGDQVCGVDLECRDTCLSSADCTNGQVCAPNGQCASTDPTKDSLDQNGNILQDPFVDPRDGTTGTAGSGGASNHGGASGKPGFAGAAGNLGEGGGGTAAEAGAAGLVVAYGTGGHSAVAGATSVSSGATISAPGGGGVAGAQAAGAPSSGGASTGGGGGGVAGAHAAGAPSSGGTSTGGTSAFNSNAHMGYAGAAGAAVCNFGWGNCDANPNDCETNLALITSCGACNVSCDPAHGSVKCDATALKCVINSDTGGCNTGYADCNKNGTDGCEASLATDANNCGACGRSCGGGKCANSQCQAGVVFDPTGASTSSFSYTGNAFLVGNQLVKLNASGGMEIRTSMLPPSDPVSQGTALATSSTPIYAVDVDATNVYYAISGSPAVILYKPLNGTASTAAKIAVNMPDTNYARLMVNASTAFYIVAYGSSNYQILTAAKTLSSASTAAPLSGLTSRATISSMVVAGANLFWAESPNQVYIAPLGGGTPVVLDATTQSGYYSYIQLATDGTFVYWNTFNGASSRIRRVAATGTPTSADVQDVAIGVNNPSTGIAVDDTYVYFYYSYQVYRASKDGSTSVESIANLNAAPYFYNLFAVDSGYVYGTGSGGQIVRVAKGLIAN
jgi:hypothetical protein